MRRSWLIGGLAALLAAVAVVVFITGGDDAKGDAGEVARTCSRSQAPPVSTPPEHARYRALSERQRAGLGDVFALSGIPAPLITGRRVTITTGQGTGVVVVNHDPDLVVIPGPGDDDDLYNQFEGAFREAADAQGLTLSSEEIGGEPVLIASRFGLVNVIGRSGCYGFAAFTSRPAEARAIASAVIAEGAAG